MGAAMAKAKDKIIDCVEKQKNESMVLAEASTKQIPFLSFFAYYFYNIVLPLEYFLAFHTLLAALFAANFRIRW